MVINTKNIVIAIDGPAGAGKSSVAKMVADRLNVQYIDSGAIYRILTKKILDSKVKKEEYTIRDVILKNVNISFSEGEWLLDGLSLSNEIRSEIVSSNVSKIASMPAVRDYVIELLRKTAGEKSVVMDGRDIGTVVFPDADYKFYLDASVGERARRRLNESDEDLDYDAVVKSIEFRDKSDMERDFGALKRADDAEYIDTTDFSLNEVVDIIIKKIV